MLVTSCVFIVVQDEQPSSHETEWNISVLAFFEAEKPSREGFRPQKTQCHTAIVTAEKHGLKAAYYNLLHTVLGQHKLGSPSLLLIIQD